MKRQISISEETQVYLNAILDLERLTSDVYDVVRAKYSKDDQPSDPTGDDILKASSGLREVLDSYLHDNLNFNLTSIENTTGPQAVL